ncbi:MAG: hypothetical protein HPY44_02085 [Armatimonadetes bacterium]|nr:hypothetical protein [Armatimonadota bacterium]
MNRDSLAPVGCAAVVALFVILFAMSAIAQANGHYAEARALFRAALTVAIGGPLVVGAVLGVQVWLYRGRIDQAQQDLIQRAERLRREREQARARAAAATPPAAVPRAPTIQGKTAPIVGQAGSSTSADRVVTPAAIRAEKDLKECPVCQTRIFQAEQIVSCPVCRATHHKDCWEYNGGCAVFGCKARL